MLRLREIKYLVHSKAGLIKEAEVKPRSLIPEAPLKPLRDIRLHILSSVKDPKRPHRTS